jgi:geranylgeranyl diphosphate synthase type II
MIRLKTAVLVGGALKIGALIGSANSKDADLLYQFGENLGIAFQLQDDILDVYGDPIKFGKQVGGDIISNKKTYLLIKALELAKGEELAVLDQWLNLTDFDSEEKVNAVKEIYNNLGVKILSGNTMHTYAQKAMDALEKINTPQENKKVLEAFADLLIKREN